MNRFRLIAQIHGVHQHQPAAVASKEPAEPDELQLPSPPQRRLSRSSIDLRDLEPQPHEKVPHTDSAPSIIITDHFSFDGKCGQPPALLPTMVVKPAAAAAAAVPSTATTPGKSSNSLQHLLKAEVFEQQLRLDDAMRPLTPAHLHHHHHHQLLKPKSVQRQELEMLRDNTQLARFIEDNFYYFKKQNNTIGSDALLRNVNCGRLAAHASASDSSNMFALSESDFEFYRNQSVETEKTFRCLDGADDDGSGSGGGFVSKPAKLSARSDSEFVLNAQKTTGSGGGGSSSSCGRRRRSRALSGVKSPIGFAKQMLAGLSPGGSATAASGPAAAAATDAPPNNTRPPPGASVHRDNRTRQQPSPQAQLSRSCNGSCYAKSTATPSSTEQLSSMRSLQRVLSEGNNTHRQQQNYRNRNENERDTIAPPEKVAKQQTAIDIFLQFMCESNAKGASDGGTTSVLDDAGGGDTELVTLPPPLQPKRENTAAAVAVASSDPLLSTISNGGGDPKVINGWHDGTAPADAPKAAIFTFSPDEPATPTLLHTLHNATTPNNFNNSQPLRHGTAIPTVALVPPISPNNLATPERGQHGQHDGGGGGGSLSMIILNEHTAGVDEAPASNGGGAMRQRHTASLCKKERNRPVVTYAVSVAGESVHDVDGNGDGDGDQKEDPMLLSVGGGKQFNAMAATTYDAAANRPSMTSTSE